MSQMNEITMTQKQMMDALESYLNQHVLKSPVNVTGVEKAPNTQGTFTIRISPTFIEEPANENG